MKIKRNQKGFTLIEVVLVLAIGGLIFLLAFLAFQQVSRNRRDTQRRSDMGRLVAELQNYAGDRSGVYPTAATLLTPEDPANFNGFLAKYMGSPNFKDPSGYLYTPGAVSTSTTIPAGNFYGTDYVTIDYQPGNVCTATGVTPSIGSVAVRLKLESGTVTCRDSK